MQWRNKLNNRGVEESKVSSHFESCTPKALMSGDMWQLSEESEAKKEDREERISLLANIS